MARTISTYRPLIRQVAGAIVLSGSSQYVDLGAAGPIATVTGPFTLAAWFKRNSFTGVISVVGDRGSGAIQHFTINFNSSYRSVPALTTTGGGSAFTILQPYPVYQWQHNIIRYDGVNGTTFRMGQVETQVARTGTVTLPTGSMAIGSGNGGARYWSGLIAETRLWSTALTDQECADVYAGVDKSGKSGEWLLASNANDTTGTNNGTLVGSPTFASTDVPFSLRGPVENRSVVSERVLIS